MEQIDYKTKYEDLLLDYDNLKSRVESEKNKVRQDSRFEMITDIFEIYKDLKSGLVSGDEGCRYILKKLIASMKSKNIEILDKEFLCNIGRKFDERYMEAVSVDYTSNQNADGYISRIMMDGVADAENGKIIVYPKVTVYKYNG